MSRPLRVLQSFPEPRSRTNPYVVMLRAGLDATPGVAVSTFSWRRALVGGYDVFHVHWPEILVTGRGRHPVKALARQLLFLLLLLRIRLGSVAVVRTAHNLHPHETEPWPVRALLALTDRWTALVIRLNDHTPVPARTAVETIPHGHYRDWYAEHPVPPADPGRTAFVGIIRPYKNVEELVRAFREVGPDHTELSLEIAGNPAPATLGDRLRAAAAGDARVSLTLAHLSDAELVAVVGRAALVALPYREMHNSGAALMALSLDRPVLVPRNEVTSDLAAETGEGWVQQYDGALTGERIVEALRQVHRLPPGSSPDLSLRGWDRAGADHLHAYHRAVALTRGASRLRRRRS